MPARTSRAALVPNQVDRGAVPGSVPGREGHGADGQATLRFPERHVDREVRATSAVRVHLGELAGAVERVDDPDAPRGQARRVALGLLGQHGIVRTLLGEGRREPGLGGEIPRPAKVAAVAGCGPGIRPSAQRQEDLTGPGSQRGGQARVVGSGRLRDEGTVHALVRHQGLPAVIRYPLRPNSYGRVTRGVSGGGSEVIIRAWCSPSGPGSAGPRAR